MEYGIDYKTQNPEVESSNNNFARQEGVQTYVRGVE